MPDPRLNELTLTDEYGQPRIFFVGRTDRETVAIDAQQAVSTVTAEMVRIPDSGPAATVVGPIESTVADGTATVRVTVNGALAPGGGLERDALYQVAVTMTNPTGRRWTRTLPIIVRA